MDASSATSARAADGTDLPEGYTSREPTVDDAGLVHELIVACEVHDLGEAHVDLEDIVSDWRRPDIDVPRDGRFVLAPDGSVAGYGEVFSSRAEGYVLPAHRGRGIGRWITGFVERRAREQGAPFVRQVAGAENVGAAELLQLAGYEHTDDAWVLEVATGAAVNRPALPPDVEVRDYVPGDDDEAAWRVIEDAFAPWPNRQLTTLEAWRALTVQRAGFEPWLLPLLVRGGAVVGAAYCIDVPGDPGEGWVQQLAVRDDQRGQGLGAALLHEAFDRFAVRGRAKVGLSTDSRTGALTLYERVGMHVVSEYRGYALQLG